MLVHTGAVVTRINVHQAKTHFSQYLDQVEQGETIVVCRRNVPVAELRPLAKAPEGRRPIGLAKGTFELTKKFFDPLPSKLLDDFDANADRMPGSKSKARTPVRKKRR